MKVKISVCVILLIILTGCSQEEVPIEENKNTLSHVDKQILGLKKDKEWQLAVKSVDLSEDTKRDKLSKLEDYMFFVFDKESEDVSKLKKDIQKDIYSDSYLTLDFDDDIDILQKIFKGYIVFDLSKDKASQDLAFNYYMYLKISYLQDDEMFSKEEFDIVSENIKKLK